jgi:hypothetical protein
MSFVSYVLLVGLLKGISSGFTPDVLIQAIWRCLMLQMFEVCLLKFGLSLMQVSIPFMDLFAYTGYKYVGLCVNSVGRVLGRPFTIASSLYCSGMLAFFVLKTFGAVVPATTSGGPPRHIVILAFAALQFVVVLFLCWL